MPARHIVLYGSYAKGTARPDSDIDIAVIVDKVEGDYLDQQAKLYRLRRSVDLRIEPVLIEYGQDKSGFPGRSWIQDTYSIPPGSLATCRSSQRLTSESPRIHPGDEALQSPACPPTGQMGAFSHTLRVPRDPNRAAPP
jgi:hypothetical protein